MTTDNIFDTLSRCKKKDLVYIYQNMIDSSKNGSSLTKKDIINALLFNMGGGALHEIWHFRK